MTSLSYVRIFCLESQKIDGTEYFNVFVNDKCYLSKIMIVSLKHGRNLSWSYYRHIFSRSSTSAKESRALFDEVSHFAYDKENSQIKGWN